MTIRVGFRMVTPRSWVGGTNYLMNVCRALRDFAPTVESVFFAPEDVGATTLSAIERATGTKPIPLKDRRHRDDALAILGFQDADTWKALSRAGVDVLFESTGYYGPKPPIPAVSWMPDFQHRHLPHFFSQRARLTREIRYRRIASTRSHILLSSRDAANDLERFYGKPLGDVHVVPFAVGLEAFPTWEAGEAVRTRLDLPERFLYLPNQFWPHKNHAVVVEALHILGRDAPVIACSGGGDANGSKLVERLTERATSLSVARSFRILGQISHQDVLSLNARADAVINPSLFEGWSTTVEESKALGTPLALSNLPVHFEQVGDAAIFFDPASPPEAARAIDAAAQQRRMPLDVVQRQTENEKARMIFAQRLEHVFRASLGL